MMYSLRKFGLILASPSFTSIVAQSIVEPQAAALDKLEQLILEYEKSSLNPGASVDPSILPNIDNFLFAAESACKDLNVRRFAIFFDEAAHVFRPDQQRQFFTLFRDLRTPYVSCNAAVYPGLTFYGDTFQAPHDSEWLSINRPITDSEYLDKMREIVERQASAQLQTVMSQQQGRFAVLAYAAHGNPRHLLKTVKQASNLSAKRIEEVLREFYRSELLSEFTKLAELFPGHVKLIDSGRNMFEQLLTDAKLKNDNRRDLQKEESTCYFWVHRDATEGAKQALRLLSYTGLVHKESEGMRATRREIGTRYALNLGCLFALEAEPVKVAPSIYRNLSIKRMTEYGIAHSLFKDVEAAASEATSPNLAAEILGAQLKKSIDVLDLTTWQKSCLRQVGCLSIGDVLNVTEAKLRTVYQVGEIRASRMKNAAIESALEYVSG